MAISILCLRLPVFSVPFLNNDYDYYYDDEEQVEPVTQMPEFQPSPRWPLNTERFTEADVYIPTTTWKPPAFFDNKQFNFDSIRDDNARVRLTTRPTYRPTVPTTTTTEATTMSPPIRFKRPEEPTSTMTSYRYNKPAEEPTSTVSSSSSYRFKKPEEVKFDASVACELEEMCDITEKNYPL